MRNRQPTTAPSCVPLCCPVFPYVPCVSLCSPMFPVLPCVSLCFPVFPCVSLCWSSEKYEEPLPPGALSASGKQSPRLVCAAASSSGKHEGATSQEPSATCCLQFYPNYPTLNDSLEGRRINFCPKITCCCSPTKLFLFQTHNLDGWCPN